MSLKTGLYRIRFVPVSLQPPYDGGLFATSDDINAPITAEADPTKSPQVWEVQRNNDGKYTIHQPAFIPKGFGPGPVLAGWSVASPSQSFPGGNILLRTSMTEFEIEPVGQGDKLMYSVQVPNPGGQHSPTLDAEFFVTEQNHTLVSQAFFSGLRTQRPHPHWQFIPANNQ